MAAARPVRHGGRAATVADLYDWLYASRTHRRSRACRRRAAARGIALAVTEHQASDLFEAA